MSKTLIFHIDGTCGDPFDANDKASWISELLNRKSDKSISNVLKLHLLAGGRMDNSQGNVKGQHSFYYSGVGTHGGALRKALNAAIAPKSQDISEIMKKVGEDLRNSYLPGDKVMLFGFSRGAAIARLFASQIENHLPEGAQKNGFIDYLGAFDTVASIGIPNLSDGENPVSDVVFENGSVSIAVKKALHLVALDEKRKAFRPILMNNDQRVTEIWMAGAHSDVGGGFDNDGLSDLALSTMMQHVQQNSEVLYLAPKALDYDGINGSEGFGIDFKDMEIRQNHLGQIHSSSMERALDGILYESREVYTAPAESHGAHMPRVHSSVVARIQDSAHMKSAYRPKSLSGVTYLVDSLDRMAPMAITRGPNALPVGGNLGRAEIMSRRRDIDSTLEFL